MGKRVCKAQGPEGAVGCTGGGERMPAREVQNSGGVDCGKRRCEGDRGIWAVARGCWQGDRGQGDDVGQQRRQEGCGGAAIAGTARGNGWRRLQWMGG
ncbi:hypothetical protein KI387_038231, partial [Taxus chinensis]